MYNANMKGTTRVATIKYAYMTALTTHNCKIPYTMQYKMAESLFDRKLIPQSWEL